MRQAERRARTTATLVETAARVFAELGYERAALDAIVHDAGYSKGALYANFRSKLDLFEAVIDAQVRESEIRTSRAASALAAGASPLECAGQYCHLPGAQQHAQLVAEAWRIARLENRVRVRLRALRTRRLEILQEACTAGNPPRPASDAALIAKLIDAELVARFVELTASA